MAVFEEEKQKKKISQLLRQEEEETVRLLSEKYKIPYLNLAVTPVNLDALKIVPEVEARAGELAVFQKMGKRLDIAVKNPEKPETLNVLKKLESQRYSYSLYLVSKTNLQKAWGFYKQVLVGGGAITGQIQISTARLEEFQNKVTKLSDVADLITNVGTKRTTDVLEIIIAGALKNDASDVHLEPQAEAVRLRYRLDGMLQDVTTLEHPIYKFLLSRVKLISELKLNVTAKGQDGRFTIKVPRPLAGIPAAEGGLGTGGAEMEVRTSTLPGPYGENIAMRILNPAAIALELEDLGMQPWIRETMEKELERPNGMILTTGPTGSGKTTTLYAFVKLVHKPGVKIITLEDPIEYHLTGIEQTQVEPERGYDFASGLRSILRQDPDVLLVGEIRDLETAETAMHASLTGHLVFSTLHTNNAAGTIPRLLDIGVKPAIIAPAINAAMAQRLLRRLCTKCRVQSPATQEEKRVIEEEIAGLPPNFIDADDKEKVGRGSPHRGGPPKIKKPDVKSLKLWRAKECQECNFIGYKGRISVYEIILIDDKIEELIFKDPSESAIKKAAFEQGQITLRQDGILKVIAGITDLAEVDRVVGAGIES